MQELSYELWLNKIILLFQKFGYLAIVDENNPIWLECYNKDMTPEIAYKEYWSNRPEDGLPSNNEVPLNN